MGKLFGLLLKKWHIIVVVVSLLAGQAYCELALPAYTADIVDVGIQRGGIEAPVPERITREEMEKILLVAGDDIDADDVLSRYTLSGGVYALNGDVREKSKAYENLGNSLSLSMLIIYYAENMPGVSADSGDGGGGISAEIESYKEKIRDGMVSLGADEGQVDKNFSEIMEMLKTGDVDFTHPFAQIIIKTVKEQLKTLDPAIIKNAAILQTREIHKKAGIDVDKEQMDYMFKSGGIMILFAFGSMAAAVLTTFLAARVAAFFARETRGMTLRKVLRFGNGEFDDLSVASLITRCTNDVQQTQMFLAMGLRLLIFAPIMGFGALFKVMRKESAMGWVIGLAVGVIFLIVFTLFFIAVPKFHRVQKLVDNLNRISREILTGLPVIRAFSSEEREKKRFDAANADLTKVNIFINRVMATMFPTMMFIMNGVSVLIIWEGAKQIDAGAMLVGDLIAFINYAMQIIMSFLMLSMLSVVLPRAAISFKRIGQVLDKEISVLDPETPVKFGGAGGENLPLLEFRGVSFRYRNAEENALSDISFVSNAGETTAIIGSTGSGKSTLVNLIPRFFDATEGEVLVCGVNVKDVTLADLRGKIGYIPQKSSLFSGTLRSNISYSDGGMDEGRVTAAAKISQAEEFILTKENKYDEPVSQGGANISGGQRQRISIARAIAKNPEIYIFDDSFSALDFKTDAALRKALFESGVTKNGTVIVVAQRISTVMNADRIIVLDRGRVAGAGTHRELLEACEPYRQTAYSQLSKEELERGGA
ncbi:MAG: ABC transporter ATP-binding protein/permease [Oscillospiraceae bacterium]|jgi:ATP-binding cassette subfamily B protein|nr:ABC transporter ATP-binding protein/permease [Oscillospiraceae bacterium]